MPGFQPKFIAIGGGRIMAFPERFLDELTERNDIVDVVSRVRPR